MDSYGIRAVLLFCWNDIPSNISKLRENRFRFWHGVFFELLSRPIDKIKMTPGWGRWPRDLRKLGQFSCALPLEKSVHWIPSWTGHEWENMVTFHVNLALLEFQWIQLLIDVTGLSSLLVLLVMPFNHDGDFKTFHVLLKTFLSKHVKESTVWKQAFHHKKRRKNFPATKNALLFMA